MIYLIDVYRTDEFNSVLPESHFITIAVNATQFWNELQMQSICNHFFTAIESPVN